MSGTERVALSGSLAVFPAQEVLQWMVHHMGENVIAFELPEGLEVGRGCLSVHMRDGQVRSLKTTGFVPLADAPLIPAGSSGASDQAASVPPDGQEAPPPFLQPRRGTLGAMLLEKKHIDSGELRYGLALQHELREKEAPAPLLGEVLQGLGLLAPETLDEALKDLALLRFAELLNCRAGGFSVIPGKHAPPFVEVGQRVDHLLLRAAHLADELGFAPGAADR